MENKSKKKFQKRVLRKTPRENNDILLDIKTYDQDLRNLKQNKRNAKLQALAKRKDELNERSAGFTPGVIYLGHIPEGFTQKAIKEYFSQFGDVGRLRLACSKRTGKSKGYAFIEFKCDEVAKVVAETMNNYYMFEKLLKCSYISKEEAREDFFRGHRFNHKLVHKKYVSEYNKPKDQATVAKHTQSRIKKLQDTEKKLASMGINFSFSLDHVKQSLKNITKNSKKGKRDVMSKQLTSLSNTDDNSQEINSSINSNVNDFSFANVFSTEEFTDSSKHTLEIDSSDDDEVSFTTPPNARKTVKNKNQSGKKPKNSFSTPDISDNSKNGKKYSLPKMLPNPFQVTCNKNNVARKPNLSNKIDSNISKKKPKRM